MTYFYHIFLYKTQGALCPLKPHTVLSLLPTRVAEHTFKAKVLINLRPMDTKAGEIKVLSLLFCCIRQTRPIRESITGSDTIIRLSINVRLVNPYFCNLQLLHTILFTLQS